MDTRRKLAYSSSFQCEFEITLGPWSVDCEEPCHMNTNYCKGHFNEEGRIDCTGSKRYEEDRIEVHYSSLYQCEYEYTDGVWRVDCKEVCYGDTHYCEKHQ